jgi:hypothetical protein
MADKASKTEPTFDFNTVTAIVYCMLQSGIVLGEKHYQVMAKLDGQRTAFAYQHEFRTVKRRAKELLDKGDILDYTGQGESPTKKRAKGSASIAKPNTKRGKPT